MASGNDERDRLSREDKGFLLAAVLETYQRGAGREIVLSDLIVVLNDNEFNVRASAGMNIGPRLGLKLSHFTAKGQYGKFFDGRNQFKIDSRFTVFELANLSSHPDLQLVVLLNLMFFITNFVSDEQMLKERKFLLIDEAWQLLKMSNTADFIANAFKTFRKYRCSTVAITQEVADLLQQKSGLAILANTANKIFLKQEHGIVNDIQQQLGLSNEITGALKSIKTVKGKYSEALVITSSSSGVIRLVPNPFLYWVASSESRDNDYLKEVQKQKGGNLLEAIKHCAKERPYGIR
jgi:conjugal transfer ATP-binding protein TraC